MKSNTDLSKVPNSKLGLKADVNDNLKSLPMPEVEKKLGSSTDGLSQAEAQKRLTQYGPNEIAEKKTNAFLFHLDYAHIQTLMYFKLPVAGNLTIFLTRTRGAFWSMRPARVLLLAELKDKDQFHPFQQTSLTTKP